MESVIMPTYLIAFIISGVLLAALAFMQVTMRRQVHEANYGIQEISPWDVRFANDLGIIWKLHKRAFEHSALRSWFLALSAAWIASVLFAVVDLLLTSR
jgi:hypothetical protein